MAVRDCIAIHTSYQLKFWPWIVSRNPMFASQWNLCTFITVSYNIFIRNTASSYYIGDTLIYVNIKSTYSNHRYLWSWYETLLIKQLWLSVSLLVLLNILSDISYSWTYFIDEKGSIIIIECFLCHLTFVFLIQSLASLLLLSLTCSVRINLEVGSFQGRVFHSFWRCLIFLIFRIFSLN